MIAGIGAKCPVCGKKKKLFVKQGKANSDYNLFASGHVQPRPKEPINRPVHIKYLFYMHTRRKVDSLNLQAAADDLLVSTGVLKDDNSDIVKHHDGTRVFYDKENPRTEIYIYEEDGNG
jgi:Holliday junction resolvase RusA-like endonuclease